MQPARYIGRHHVKAPCQHATDERHDLNAPILVGCVCGCPTCRVAEQRAMDAERNPVTTRLVPGAAPLPRRAPRQNEGGTR